MKKIFISFILFSIPLFSLIAQETVEFFLKNNTQKEISSLYLTTSSSDFWGAEILKGSSSIPVNGTIKLAIIVSAHDSFYDIKALSSDGSTYLTFENSIKPKTTIILTEADFDGQITPEEKVALPPEEREALDYKSSLPKKYIDGYQQGFLNGYTSGLEAGYKAGKAAAEKEAAEKTATTPTIDLLNIDIQ